MVMPTKEQPLLALLLLLTAKLTVLAILVAQIANAVLMMDLLVVTLRTNLTAILKLTSA